MTFSSLTFLFLFFPITFLLYALIRNHTARNLILAAASLVFYAFGEPVAVIIMLISIVLNYIFGLGASGKKWDKTAVLLAVLLNIGMLAVYKYTGFFTEIINGLFRLSIPVPQIRLPIGISFFTFQGLSYVIDVYRNKSNVQKNLFSVLLYISFFPQLIAGPIVRYSDIAAQIDRREFTSDRISRGVCRFLFGLAKKVLIANQMGLIADKVFSVDGSSLSTGTAWIGAVCYTLQIFFDFCGYSDMAIGLGCIFGFDFLENFNYPFISGSIQEFWRRWHISLSTWFKEYVYIPLGGNRKGKARTTLNKWIVFFLTGLWHGASFTFILWGLWHGLWQMLETYQIVPTKKKWFKPIGHVYTLLVVIIGFVFFRADNLSQGFSVVKAMFSPASGITATNSEIISLFSPLTFIVLAFALLLSTPVFKVLRQRAKESGSIAAYNILAYAGSLVLFALSVLSLVSSSYNPFIYFRF
ncbi:MAG: MBOAT family protein [Clostridia bacterium]|nr:MBOAT family protein [Clostridia bacterium]